MQGLTRMERVFGPDLMLEMVGRRELAGYRHFLCGGGPGVMAGASRGASSQGGTVIGILPGDDRARADARLHGFVPVRVGRRLAHRN